MGDVELAWVSIGDVTDVALARCRAALDPDDEARAARYLFERNTREFVITRALARAVLAPLVPGPLRFTRTEAGKPELEPPGELRFNLTNTIHLVCCGVTRGRTLGVDAEPLARAPDVLALAETIFTPAERAALRAAGERGGRLAVELWTLKEAYMKARGLGLALPPEDMAFEPPAGASWVDAPARLSWVRPEDPPLGRWHFRTLEIEAHAVSVCAEGPIGAIEVRRVRLS